MQYVIQKSYVQAHERKLKSGQVVQIQAHYDKRTKKHTEHAPEHGHDVSHLSGEEKDLFNRMHREQHFMSHYHATGYRKMAQHHESRASELETEAVEHEKAGRKKRASKLRDSATKHREKATKYHDAAGKMDKIVQGIGALKEKLVAGSGKLADEDTNAAHARYAEKAGHKFKTLAPKQANDKPTESGHAEGDKWVMPLKAAVEEHKELVQAAETPTKADDKAQLAEQKAELARMEANHNPLNEAQRKSIEQSNSAWEAWKSGVETPSRAAFREQARSGKLDHLYALAEEDKKRINAETEQRQAEAKQRQKARNDAWRERNLPRLAAAKKVSEDFERNQQAAKVAAVKERLDAEQAKKEAAAAAKKARNEQASNAAPAKRTLPKTGRVSNDDPSVWGSWLLGHEGESWAHVRTLAPAHLQDDYSAPKVVVQKDVAEQIQGKIDNSQPKDDGPKEGERNAEGLVFRDGRWHRDNQENLPESPASTINKKHEVSLSDVLVEWKPRFKTSVQPEIPTLNAKMRDKVFSHVGSLSDLSLTASVSFMGSKPPQYAVDKVKQIQAAEAAGYKLTRVKIKGAIGFIMEKGGHVLTPAGAEALVSGVFDRQQITETGDHHQDFSAQRLSDAKVLAKWMATLPPSTLESPSAFATKLNNTPMSQHFSIQRDLAGRPYLATKDGKSRIYAPSGSADYQDSLRKIIHYASGDEGKDWAEQERIADKAANASKAAGKTLHDVLREGGFVNAESSAPKVVVQKDVAEQIQGKIGAESAVPKTKNRKGKKTPESEWPQKRRDVISGLKERGWVIAPDNDKTAELLVDGHHVGSANLHMNFPEEVLTRLTKRNPAWVDSDAASKKFKVSGGESAGEIAENIDKMARAHHEIVAPPEKRTVLAEKPPLNVATKLQGKDVVFTKTSSFGVIDGRAIAQYGEHLRDHKFKNGYYADYRDATPDEVKASEKEAAKAAKKAAADAKKAAAKFMNAPSGYASFDDWYADADMPTKLEDGTWVDLETGLPYRAADSRSPKSRSGNAASSKPKRESAPSAPVPQGLPPFSDGKTKGAADYYVKIAQNLLEASKKPHARSALMAERSKTFTTKAGGLATAWASKTQNSKLLVEFFNKLLNG